MTGEAWAAIAAIVGSLSVAVSGVLVAKVNATTRAASEAAEAATAARDYAQPTGNGYADETRDALRRIEETQREHTGAIRDLTERHVRTNGWLTRHLADHAQNDIRNSNREE